MTNKEFYNYVLSCPKHNDLHHVPIIHPYIEAVDILLNQGFIAIKFRGIGAWIKVLKPYKEIPRDRMRANAKPIMEDLIKIMKAEGTYDKVIELYKNNYCKSYIGNTMGYSNNRVSTIINENFTKEEQELHKFKIRSVISKKRSEGRRLDELEVCKA